jgi:hypothetical protein
MPRVRAARDKQILAIVSDDDTAAFVLLVVTVPVVTVGENKSLNSNYTATTVLP